MAGARNSKSATATSQSKAGPDTEARIFLAAERLFADRGFDGVSVRDIVHEAGVNLAAVSYHFGSKSSLLLSIFRKRTREMNRERHAMLREAEAKAGGAPPLREILRALLGPPILWRDPASQKDTASQFIARAMAEVTPELRTIPGIRRQPSPGLRPAHGPGASSFVRAGSLLGAPFRGRPAPSMHRFQFQARQGPFGRPVRHGGCPCRARARDPIRGRRHQSAGCFRRRRDGARGERARAAGASMREIGRRPARPR